MKYLGDSNPYNVEAVWEVRLRPETVEQIRSAAQNYGCSMSWVVRYCVFKLYRRFKLSQAAMRQMADDLREKNQPKPLGSHELHRLRVCLYGDDERIFIELKYRFRLTTTMVVRIALRLYLKRLLKIKVSVWDLFYWGLKFFATTNLVYSRKLSFPQVDIHVKKFLRESDYWSRPPGPLPDYLLV